MRVCSCMYVSGSIGKCGSTDSVCKVLRAYIGKRKSAESLQILARPFFRRLLRFVARKSICRSQSIGAHWNINVYARTPIVYGWRSGPDFRRAKSRFSRVCVYVYTGVGTCSTWRVAARRYIPRCVSSILGEGGKRDSPAAWLIEWI